MHTLIKVMAIFSYILWIVFIFYHLSQLSIQQQKIATINITGITVLAFFFAILFLSANVFWY